jgi:hypothetical protein
MKLYIVVAAALSVGLKAAQACHAMRAFTAAYPHLDAYWFHEHNNIVVLEHHDVPSLADALEGAGLRLARFHEPDLDDELTAICAEPAAWRELSNVRLMRGDALAV